MANVADKLADRLEARGLPGGIGPGSDPRRAFDVQDPAAWDIDYQAAALLLDVERILIDLRAGGEDVSIFAAALGTWFEGVLVYRSSRSERELGKRVAAPAQHVALLRALGRFIDEQGKVTLGQALTATTASPSGPSDALQRQP